MTREFWKIPLSLGIIGSSKDLVRSPADALDHLRRRLSDGDHLIKISKFFVSIQTVDHRKSLEDRSSDAMEVLVGRPSDMGHQWTTKGEETSIGSHQWKIAEMAAPGS